MNNKIFSLVFITIAIGLGSLYSIYNIDTHHWGFILGTATDFIQGKKLFTETYVQYGAGQPIFFMLMSYFFPITLTSIGIMTSSIYALTLLVLFYSILKISNQLIALIIMTFIFILHPYAIYPWPDYFAGFFLALSCLMLTGKKDSNEYGVACISGLLLFISFIFRNTYLISIGASAFAYCALSLIFPRVREKRIFISISTFALCLIGYILFLNQRGDFHLWFNETINAGTSMYGVGISHVIARLKEAYFPSGTINVLFSIFYFFGTYVLLSLFFKRKSFNGITLFFALIGLAGIVQVLLIYEMFRIQNACSPLYLVGAAVLYDLFPKPENFWSQKKLLYPLIWFFIFFMLRFPHATSMFPFLDGRYSYTESTIPVFKWHRFRVEVNEYYDELSKLICDGKSKIENHTMDSIIPYLCPDQKNALAIPFYYPEMLKIVNPEVVLTTDEFVVADVGTVIQAKPETKLVEIGQVNRPDEVRFMNKGLVKVYRIVKNN